MPEGQNQDIQQGEEPMAKAQAQAQTPLPVELSAMQKDDLVAMVIRETEKWGSSQGIKVTEKGVEFTSFAGMQRYARMLVMAGMVPTQGKDDHFEDKMARATMAISMGQRLGLNAEQSVVSIYVVNSRPVLFGDAPLAVCRRSKEWDETGFREYWLVGGKEQEESPTPLELKKDDTAAVCESKRLSASKPRKTVFSVAHAKQASLSGKSGPWSAYTQRMLPFRARGYNLRDNFGDALQGMGIMELEDLRPVEAEREPIPMPEALPEPQPEPAEADA